MTIEQTLQDRKKTHGDFSYHALITQNIKCMMNENRSRWAGLSPSQRKALEMIAHKIGRILAGNPNEPDHWHDIAGYATLVQKELNGNTTNPGPTQPDP